MLITSISTNSTEPEQTWVQKFVNWLTKEAEAADAAPEVVGQEDSVAAGQEGSSEALPTVAGGQGSVLQRPQVLRSEKCSYRSSKVEDGRYNEEGSSL